MGYLGYYLAWFALSYLIRQPWLLVGLVGLWLLRGVLPRPGALLGALGRAGRLREQVRVNRGNITARRDLATIYLDLLRPRRAAELLAEGLALAPEDAELLYLHGLSLHRAGRHDEALQQLLRAIDKDQRLRHGHAYFVAGNTLLALARWDDAADAFERYLDFNSSDVAAHTALARAYAGSRDATAARKWLRAGIQGWHGLPGALKRRQLGAFFAAQWARVTVLREPLAIATVVAALGLLALGTRSAYPYVLSWFEPSSADQDPYELARASAASCGSMRTGDFEGAYEVDVKMPEHVGASRAQNARARARFEESMREQYADFRILADRIVAGGEVKQEFCLTKVIERTPKLLHAQAIWYFENGDPALARQPESLLFDIRLTHGEQATGFSFALASQPMARTQLSLRKLP